MRKTSSWLQHQDKLDVSITWQQFRAAIIRWLGNQLLILLKKWKIELQQRNRNYKKKLNWNYKTENYGILLNSRMEMTEVRINESEQWSNEFNLNNKEKIHWEGKKKNRDWVTCRTLTNDPVTVLLQKENRAEILLKEIMVENSSNLVKDTNLQNQEAELTLNRLNSKKYMLR